MKTLLPGIFQKEPSYPPSRILLFQKRHIRLNRICAARPAFSHSAPSSPETYLSSGRLCFRLQMLPPSNSFRLPTPGSYKQPHSGLLPSRSLLLKSFSKLPGPPSENPDRNPKNSIWIHMMRKLPVRPAHDRRRRLLSMPETAGSRPYKKLNFCYPHTQNDFLPRPRHGFRVPVPPPAHPRTEPYCTLLYFPYNPRNVLRSYLTGIQMLSGNYCPHRSMSMRRVPRHDPRRLPPRRESF